MRAKRKWIIAVLAIVALVIVVTVVAASAGPRGVELTVTGFETNRVPGISYGPTYTNYLIVSAKLELKNTGDTPITFNQNFGGPDHIILFHSLSGWRQYPSMDGGGLGVTTERTLLPGHTMLFTSYALRGWPCRVVVPYKTDRPVSRFRRLMPEWIVDRFPGLSPEPMAVSPVIDLGGKGGS